MGYNKIKEINLSKAVLIFGLSALGLIALNGLFINYKDGKSLTNNYKLTKGKITRFEIVAARNTYPAICSFQVNDKNCLCELPSDLFCKVLNANDENIIRTISFDIAYDIKKPSNCQLLSSVEIYEKYNKKYPLANSKLAEVLEKYFNCKWTLWRWMN